MKQKKIGAAVLFVLLLVFSAVSVSAWSATRSISANTVTINIDPSTSEGVFTIQETLTGATVTTKPGTCGYDAARRVLTCNYDQNVAGTVVYETAGSGTVSGTITGRSVGAPSSTTQDITGDTAIPGGAAPECGDGTITSPETCDDRNTITETACPYGTPNCQLCNADCTAVLNLVGSYCGNNVLEGVEQCDGTDLGGATCASETAAGPGSTGILACRSGTCDFDTNGCVQAELPPATCPPTCPITISGDNVIDKQNLAQCIVQAIDDNAGILQRITGIARCLQASPLFQ